MELNQEAFSAVVGVKINDGGIYDIPSGMSNNLFVASDFKTLSKVRLPMGGIPTTSGAGTSGEFLFVSNMGDQGVKPVLEVIQNRHKKVFSGIGEDISVDTVAIQWGETILFYYPDSGAKEIYFIRFPSPSEIGGLPKNPTFNTVTVTDHIAAKQLDLDNWLLMYSKKAGQNPGIRIAQNFLSGVGATATKSLDRESCYLEIGGAEYGAGSYRLIGMGYQKEQKDLQPLMFGFQETSQSGNTIGDFVVFLRETSANETPKEVLRITNSGEIIGKGIATKDLSLVSKKYVDDKVSSGSGQSGVFKVFDDSTPESNPGFNSQVFNPGDTIFIDGPNKYFTFYQMDSKVFKVGDKAEFILNKGKAGKFGELCVIQFQDGGAFNIGGKLYASVYLNKPCRVIVQCVAAGYFHCSFMSSDETYLTPTLSDPIG